MKLTSERWTSSLLPNRSPTRPQSGAVSAAIAGDTPSVSAGPERDVADFRDAQLAEVEREERHHQREAGEADEGGRGDGRLVTLPGMLRTDLDSPLQC